MTIDIGKYASPWQIEAICLELAFPPEVAQRLARHISEADLSSLAAPFSRLFSLDTGADAAQAVDAACQSPADPTGDSGLKALSVYMAAVLHSRERYQTLGLDNQVFIDTMLIFRRFVLEHLESFGRYGFDRSFWIYRQLSLNLFRLGVLEFEMCPLASIKGQVGPAQPGDPILSVHIPSDAAMGREGLTASYRMAREFFAMHFPQYHYRCVCCHTWLLAPILKDLLKPGSRILTFQEDYTVTQTDPQDESVMQWVFKRKYDRYEDLPEDTSLMRAIKQLLLSGGSIGNAMGYVENFNSK